MCASPFIPFINSLCVHGLDLDQFFNTDELSFEMKEQGCHKKYHLTANLEDFLNCVCIYFLWYIDLKISSSNVHDFRYKTSSYNKFLQQRYVGYPQMHPLKGA